MRKNTILETLTAIVFLIFVGVVLYYSFYPFKVTTLNSIGIDAAEYCRGEWVQVELDFVKHMDIQADITWYIVDGVVYELESPGVNRAVGDNHLIVSKQIPYSILPGRYNLRIEAVYQVHPLHKPIVNEWNTPKFEVLDADKCPSDPDENLSFPDPINRPIIEQPTTRIEPVIINPIQQPGVEQSATVITEQREESQVFIPEKESTPIKDFIETVTGPIKGLLQ
jgi:hypothetical protein